tara:strand:- start:24 stop:551 length:528 start_codon:yes stop_codon:yes gene_type:complete
MTRNDRDFYPTPHSIIREMLTRIEWAQGLVWEPCAGDNRLVDAMRSMGATVIDHDIETGDDFFDWRTAHADTLITNPPFKPMRKFIDHAFNIGVQRMALVCSERLWSCERGREQWQRHRPSRFVNLTWREDYLRKGGSPDRALAVSIWDTPHADKCSYEIWNKSDQPSLFNPLNN